MWDIVKIVISASPQLCHVPAPSLCWYKHSQIWTIHTNHFFLSWVSFNDQQFPNPVCHGTNNYKKKYIEKASSDSIWIIVGWTVNHIPRSLYYHNWGDSKPQVAGKKFWSTEENKLACTPHITSLPSIPPGFAVKKSRINTRKWYKQCIPENYWDEWITAIIESGIKSSQITTNCWKSLMATNFTSDRFVSQPLTASSGPCKFRCIIRQNTLKRRMT